MEILNKSSNQIPKKRGRPRKQKSELNINDINPELNKSINNIINESLNNISTNNLEYNSDNSDDIRPPDNVVTDRLIDDNDLTINDDDDDLTKALKISKLEYLYKNNMLTNNFYYSHFEDENNNMFYKNNNEEQDFNETPYIEDDNNIDNILKLSNEAMEEEQRLMELKIKEESEKIEKDNRIKSLELFCKKVKTLTFTKSDIDVKNYVDKILDNYFNLIIDFVIVDDEIIYKNLYDIIDSYYKIPQSKNLKRLAISEEEDKILRTIFRK